MEVMTNESSRSKESKSAKGAFKAHIRNKKGRLMYFKRQYIRINFAKGQNGSCLINKLGMHMHPQFIFKYGFGNNTDFVGKSFIK